MAEMKRKRWVADEDRAGRWQLCMTDEFDCLVPMGNFSVLRAACCHAADALNRDSREKDELVGLLREAKELNSLGAMWQAAFVGDRMATAADCYRKSQAIIAKIDAALAKYPPEKG